MTDSPRVPASEVVFGLDVGTTAVKVAVFGIDRPFRYAVAHDHPLDHPKPRWSVQDPALIADHVRLGVREAVAAAGGARVLAISLSTAMHGLIGLDSAHRPITPVITWADSRAKDIARRLRASPEGESLYRRSGMPVHSMAPLTKMRWYAEELPADFHRVRWWISLKDWVIHALTGQWVTELSAASGMGLLDMRTREWSPESVDLAGISLRQLLPIRATTDALPLDPALAHAVGLPGATPVVLGAGDGPLGNVGTGAMGAGVAGLSIGTSGALRLIVREPLLDPTSGLFCYALTDDLWAVGGAISNGGSAMRWFATRFAGLGPADAGTADDIAIAMAASVPAGADGLAMIPYLLAERAPTWDPALAGSYLGLRAKHTPAHFARATIDGVAQQLWAVLQQVRSRYPVTSVRATGGVFRAPLWVTVLAGTFDLPITVTDGAEGSALGAAALGLYAVGEAPDLATALATLGDGTPDPPPVVASAADVTAYRQVREAIRDHLDGMVRIRRAFGADEPAAAWGSGDSRIIAKEPQDRDP